MGIKIEVNKNIEETEITIKVNELNQDVYEIQNILADFFKRRKVIFYKENRSVWDFMCLSSALASVE